MKNVVFFGLFIALISTSCSSDDSNFNQSNLVGTWDLKTTKIYSFANDSLVSSSTYSVGEFYLTINANGTYWNGGTEVGTDADTLNYELSTWNGKNLIITKYDNIPNDSDTLEIVSFEMPNMTVSTKIDKNSAESSGNPRIFYEILDLTKR